MKKKLKTPTFYRKKCVKWAKDEAKKRDKNICQRCGKKVEGQNAHGSHILNEGSYPLMSAEPYNIICLCFHCHIYFWHKSPIEASVWFIEKWPDRYGELREMDEEKNRHIVNWKKRWETIKTYK